MRGNQMMRALDNRDRHEDRAIHTRNLAVGYSNVTVLDGIDMTVDDGSTVALVGRSGCGKTTLLKTFAGILPPRSGEATVLGTTLPDRPEPGTLGYIPQSLGLIMHGTVLRNVLLGTLADLGRVGSLLGRFPPEAHTQAMAAIEAVGLDGDAQTRVQALSGGKRRRVAIARAFVQQPRLLLADEMLSELDEETAATMIACLETLQAETGMAVVIVEHDLDVAFELADRVLTLQEGAIKHAVQPTDRSVND